MKDDYFGNLYNYLILGVRQKSLSFQQIRNIMTLALDDFFNNKIGVDAVSFLSDDLLYSVGYDPSDFPNDFRVSLRQVLKSNGIQKIKKGMKRCMKAG